MIVGAIVGLAVLVTVALITTRGTETYEPGTPEAALQDFLQAGFNGDVDAMLDLLTAESLALCDTVRVRDRLDNGPYSSELSADLRSIEIEESTAIADVRFQRSNGSDPFDNSSRDFDERFTLERVDGNWLIAQATWPWPFNDCTRGL